MKLTVRTVLLAIIGLSALGLGGAASSATAQPRYSQAPVLVSVTMHTCDWKDHAMG